MKWKSRKNGKSREKKDGNLKENKEIRGTGLWGEGLKVMRKMKIEKYWKRRFMYKCDYIFCN